LERKRIIRKVLVLAAWLLVIGGMTTLLVAANKKQKKRICTEVLIGIKGSAEKLYIEREEVLELIEKSTGGSLLLKPLTSIKLASIEKVLEANPWISEAELYFDSKDALHVFVQEREPVVRVFTTTGYSFYLDSAGHRMPLLSKMSLRLPVVTGFTNARKWNKYDSAMLYDVKTVAGFVYNHPFWNAQIGQINITSDRKFELIPVVGDHVIKLGDAENVDVKLDRLYIFYKQVLAKVGFAKYAQLDLQYEGQVVAVNKGATSVVDSIQLRKNIESLMNRASMQTIEEDMLPGQNITVVPKNDSTVSKTIVPINSVSTKTNSNPIVRPDKNPKAVMKRIN
jgi:cell division protein FtsQ